MNADSSGVWTRVRELGADLRDALELAHGLERLDLGRVAVREARTVLEGTTGCEAEAVRALLWALGEAHAEMTG